MKEFDDNFSGQSFIYSKYRPHYPDELFHYLASLTKSHELAWDAGTGNGQSAIGLTSYFQKVIASDPSSEQIRHAYPHSQIEYRVERAELMKTVQKFNLVTVANALHWFDHAAFYKTVDEVLQPGGVLAAWAYEVPLVSTEIDQITRHFHDVVVDEFWAAPNRLVENEYRDLPFPYPLLKTPAFFSYREFDLADFVAYFNTWSATQKFIAAKGFNPTVQLENDLLSFWGDPTAKKKVTWKLILRVGRKGTIS